MMKKLPNAVKWLIIVAVLAAMAAMTFAPPGCCSHRNREGFFNGRKSPCPS